jgi:hypothetical protein
VSNDRQSGVTSSDLEDDLETEELAEQPLSPDDPAAFPLDGCGDT